MFDIFIKHVLNEEGGYVNSPNDRGGATNYGISLRFLLTHNIDVNKDNDINVKDVKKITDKEAKGIYKKYFWNPLYEKLNNIELAYKLFTLGINLGVGTAVKKLQILLSRHDYYSGDIDGIFGEKTLRGANSYIYHDSLYKGYLNEIESYYRKIAARDKTQKVFLKGWLNRLYKIYDFS